MARGREQHIEHLLRRAGFGAAEEDVTRYADDAVRRRRSTACSTTSASPTTSTRKIGQPGYVGVTARAAGGFQPRINIDDARQRWLFRMVHSQRPLQEKMALFWHNHFATAYSKIAGAFGGDRSDAHAGRQARRGSAAASSDSSSCCGEHALGNFRDLLVAVAQDPAMLVWLDGRIERARPAAGELRARADGAVHDGRRHVRRRPTSTPARGCSPAGTWRGPSNAYYAFSYNAGQHDTDAKEFSFPIYPNGGRVIPARAAAQGMQDGLDLIDAVARHPATGPRLARKLYDFFINEVGRAGRRR